MARGGKRLGAGRKQGVPNKITGTLRERLLASGPSPLEFLVELYRAPEPKMPKGEHPIVFATRYKQWAQDRVDAGKAAAPFFHPKLQSIEITENDSGPPKEIRIVFVDANPKPDGEDVEGWTATASPSLEPPFPEEGWLSDASALP